MSAELFRSLAVIAEPPRPSTQAVVSALDLPGRPDAAEYTDLFVLQLWPYASIYVGAEGKLGGEAADRVAGFWRALHLTPPAESDHVAALLGLYASLVEREAAESEPARRLLWQRSRQALLWEHLLSWLPVYLAKLEEIASPFYRAWGRLLGEALILEAQESGVPEQLPLHLREAPAFNTPDEILVPVKSGVLLVRDDLARAARESGLGLRQGERAYVLKALLQQDPEAMWGWMGSEAGRWVEVLRGLPEPLGQARDFWIGRAEISAELIGARIPV